MKTQIVLGIMSGTSLDGVDYALCTFKNREIKMHRVWSVAYPKSLRQRLLAAASDQATSYEVAQLHHDLGRFYAQKAPQAKFHYIGLHGQTIFHHPKKGAEATYQIGEPAYLAARFNVPVINQFRTMDMAFGGQGAPLATLFHREVFAQKDVPVAVNNLGGISNVTFLGASKNAGAGQGPDSRAANARGRAGQKASQKILSFDTGPANILIDYAVARITKGKKNFDDQGQMALRGLADPGLVQKWMKHPFFKKAPPKSTGREDFGPKYFEQIWKDCKTAKLSNFDIVATLTDFTARSIAYTYATYLPQLPELVILCGGGAANPILEKMIQRALNEVHWSLFGEKIKAPVKVTTSDRCGWSAQGTEAAAFALLAFRTMNGLTGNIPETTGARKAAILGQISPPPL